jgi:hypothetical protein
MKKMIVGGLAAVAAAIGIAGSAMGTAHADTSDGTIAAINAAAQFTQDVTNAGFYNAGGASAQLLLGITACNQLDAGTTPAQATANLYRNNNLDAFAAGQFVGIAVRDLCPWHFGQGYYQSMPYGPGNGAPRPDQSV